MTFVCDGRVGLHLTAYYLQEFAKGRIRVSGKCQPVDACAGVAIVHSKFPIAQAYYFADELCGLAKAHRRDENKNNEEKSGSWLDFQIIQEGITESISALRDSQYRSLEGQKLHQHRPYKVPDTWKTFVKILQAFRIKGNGPAVVLKACCRYLRRDQLKQHVSLKAHTGEERYYQMSMVLMRMPKKQAGQVAKNLNALHRISTHLKHLIFISMDFCQPMQQTMLRKKRIRNDELCFGD